MKALLLALVLVVGCSPSTTSWHEFPVREIDVAEHITNCRGHLFGTVRRVVNAADPLVTTNVHEVADRRKDRHRAVACRLMQDAAASGRCGVVENARPGFSEEGGDIVFGQIFMWYGYTGVHWNVITDVVPSDGYRLVYQTFPGGIHSGSDFYLNEAGIAFGETTVMQTPYEADSTPQSNRARKAAQYAASIDDVERILWEKNNGMYTNDWPIADVNTGEVAILLLGTHAKKLWRTSEDMAPFGTPGFLWANNNNRDPEVRKEYVAQPDDRPFDLMFSPWNRDIAFNEFYREYKGRIDANAGVRLWASSPVNRAHACDGKITTTEMANQMVFLAHHGKVTLREKFPTKGWRILPDLPGAEPHLSLGYSVVSPVFVADRLKAAHVTRKAPKDAETPKLELGEVAEEYEITKKELWRGTVEPASPAESWFVSATAAYWRILEGLDDDEQLRQRPQRAPDRRPLPVQPRPLARHGGDLDQAPKD